jgi:hypothetical protein
MYQLFNMYRYYVIIVTKDIYLAGIFSTALVWSFISSSMFCHTYFLLYLAEFFARTTNLEMIDSRKWTP